MGISVRLAESGDLAFVSQDGYVDGAVVRRKIEQREVFVAEVDGEPAGYLRIELLWSLQPYIALIRVLEPYRKRGVGRALLAGLEDALRSAGHGALFSSSQADEPEPQAWHRHMGFAECGIIRGVNEGGVGEVFFRKPLVHDDGGRMGETAEGEGRELFEAEELTASLTVSDLPASIAWYCEVLGFGLAKRFEREGKLMAARVKAGRVLLLLGQDDGAKGPGRVKGEGFSLMITTTQDIDAIAARVREAGGDLDTEPSDTPWGARIMRLRDPDGFRLTISTGMG